MSKKCLKISPLREDDLYFTEEQFDSEWYLKTYPDVAAAGFDPWIHYIKHGRFEGRRPYRNRAIAWEYHLWGGGHRLLLPRLEKALLDPNTITQERQYIAWAIARWYAAHQEWLKALNSLKPFLFDHFLYPSHAGPLLLLFESALRCDQLNLALKAFHILAQRFPDQADVLLAEVNLLSNNNFATDKYLSERRLKVINSIFTKYGLCNLVSRNSEILSLDSLDPKADISTIYVKSGPKVSVIVPVYNAQETVLSALRSLCKQTWRNLEILVIDDASEDDTWRLLQTFENNIHSNNGVKIRLLRHKKNLGAYAARNTGLSVADGDMITTHDSDDWSHPQKIEYQVKALLSAPDKVACTSHWVRSNSELYFTHWRLEDSWIYRNVSSLMFRRSVFKTLGYWDGVTINGDTEFYFRIENAFGKESLIEVLPGVPLSFGRICDDSLSRCNETNLLTCFHGVRKDYEDAAKRWHSGAKSPKDLYLPSNPKFRYFLAPSSICSEEKPVKNLNPLDLVQQSGFFDVAWYLEQYPDLQDSQLNLLEHYCFIGSLEGRDPGPEFSTTGYQYHVSESEIGSQPIIYHFLTIGLMQGLKPILEILGAQSYRPSGLNLLVCAHQAGKNLFGAERSLLDVIAVLNNLEVNVTVVLPNAINTDYVDTIKSMVRAVIILPYGWWRAGRLPNSQTMAHFERLINKYNIHAVYTNTLVLDEPLLSARAAEVITIIHVRELPFHDEALCKILGANPTLITERVRNLSDITIVNSRAVEKEIASSNSVLVPNMVDITRFDLVRQINISEDKLICIALISNNLLKKGLVDFVNIAEILEQRSVPAVCKLIGPENDFIRDLRARQRSGEISSYLQFTGYIPSPQDALAEADIVVNLSHFQESFGRTVLEAMAAARPVVTYDWGALSELVVEGETGYLVPFGEVEAIVERLVRLIQDAELRLRMGLAGRRHAANKYSFDNNVVCFKSILRKIDLLSVHTS
ncbi:glycosyltransferase [Microbulbifer sp. JMSA008]|uniref:glycosyltransferase n=1 Tax=Microbulbifer sp. JMSA008 TaxID=3243373 RepID=UPI004039CAA2